MKEYICPNCGKHTRISDNDSYYVNDTDELFCSEKCLDILSRKIFEEFKSKLNPFQKVKMIKID